MYPPHRRDLAAQHIVHACRFLRPGGVLGALTSPGVQNGINPHNQRLRDLMGRSGYTHVLGDVDWADGYLLAPSGTGRRLPAQLVFLESEE
ncbi:hypothetical protein [Streptomyces sp. NBC_00470]|uniref:hypothetical protein n=1 Tax=Streptomyces sp. NBC_00470 TaxID=2975753 RepID=UPI0030DE0960